MRVASLFSGGGGLDLGVEMLLPDSSLGYMAESDPHASKVSEGRWSDVDNLQDVRSIDWSSISDASVVTAGFPCQDISHNGKQAGIVEGTRSGLWFQVAEAIEVIEPRYLLLENVAAITSVGNGIDVVLASLAERGWDAEWGIVKASDVGAPHARARWFCVASRSRDGSPPSMSEAPGDDHPGETSGPTEVTDFFQEYAPAVARWGRITGDAPCPIDDSGRTHLRFVEWIMGWPLGSTEGLSRTQALKVLGNGVVPQQAAHAYRALLGRLHGLSDGERSVAFYRPSEQRFSGVQSSLFGHAEVRFPLSGGMVAGVCYSRPHVPASVAPTAGRLLPTPVARDFKDAGNLAPIVERHGVDYLPRAIFSLAQRRNAPAAMP